MAEFKETIKLIMEMHRAFENCEDCPANEFCPMDETSDVRYGEKYLRLEKVATEWNDIRNKEPVYPSWYIYLRDILHAFTPPIDLSDPGEICTEIVSQLAKPIPPDIAKKLDLKPIAYE